MSGTSGENPRRCTSFDPDSDMAPYVRPWKAPRKAIARERPVCQRASFSAASSASAPLFVKNTRLDSLPGASSASRCAKATLSGPKPIVQRETRNVGEVGSIVCDYREALHQSRRRNHQIHFANNDPLVQQRCADFAEFPCHILINGQESHIFH